jgi:hypothetical protein
MGRYVGGKVVRVDVMVVMVGKNQKSLPAGLPAEGGQAGFWLTKKAPTVRKGLLKRVATTYSPGFYPSTICAGRLNDSVRNGKRWTLPL